jgi:serine phosphatase RsbU (regulator of sigma subunit)
MKISIKFTLLSLFLVLLCGTLLFVLVNRETKASLEQEIRFKLERESKYAIANTDRFIYERLIDIKNLSQDVILATDTSRNKRQIAQRLQKFKQQNKLYVSISYFNANRVRIADTEEKSIGKQHSYTNYWLQSEKEDAVLDVSYSESLQSVVMHFAAVVRNAEGQRIGLVVSRVLIHSLYDVFSEVIEGENLPNMSIALMDTNGILLYSNHTEDKILIDKHPDIQLIHKYSQLAQQKTEEDGEAISSHYFVHNKQIYLYQKQEGYLNYAGHQWIFVLKIPREMAFLAAKKLSQKIYYAFIPVLLLSLLLAILFGRYVSKPIVQLSRAANAWGNGHLDTTFALTTHKNDEIGMLATQMQTMAKQLAKKMKEQDELNDELQITNDTLQDLNLDLERKNQNITASIHYAERIQSAMLPDRELLKNNFANFFILFKPKHIVSGDFYWFQETEIQIPVRKANQQFAKFGHLAKPNSTENIQDWKINIEGISQAVNLQTTNNETILVEHIAIQVQIIAVVDCTGHGVPGALMSMIGNNLLYQIVMHQKITSPEKILSKLHTGVQKVLKQEANNNKDGMDVAICVINQVIQEIEFAGVHRPLLLFSGEKMTEIKGNKVSIGGSFMPEKWHVEKHQISYQIGDRLYLYTDGFGDQFSDAENPKKFTGRKLKNTLQEIQETSIELQEDILLAEHQNWRGKSSQTDDILVLGIEL